MRVLVIAAVTLVVVGLAVLDRIDPLVAEPEHAAAPAQALRVDDRLDARLVRVIDGDTYVLWVARFGSFEKRATVDHYRLDGWRAREKDQGPETAPDGKTIIRYDGQTASRAAANVLGTAARIEVEERTLDGFGRIVARVLVDGRDLGKVLEEQKMVTPGSTMGAVDPGGRSA
jgi:endonuclease YncB( thermonuclease family)